MRTLLVVFILLLFSCEKNADKPSVSDEKNWKCVIKEYFLTGLPPILESYIDTVIVDNMTEQEIREYEKEHTFHISHYKSECYCVEL